MKSDLCFLDAFHNAISRNAKKLIFATPLYQEGGRSEIFYYGFRIYYQHLHSEIARKLYISILNIEKFNDLIENFLMFFSLYLS